MYERLCAGCHGLTGHGDGPLARYLGVRPRDFTRDRFLWRSTPSGSAPTVDDVARTIGRGIAGGVMPAFGPALRPDDRSLLARYVLALGTQVPSPPIAAPTVDLADTTARRQRGAALYAQLQCAGCHGTALHGDGPNAAAQHPRPYDLALVAPRGGADAASLFRSLRTGLDGTSMPAFSPAVSDDDLAALAVWLASTVARDTAPDASRWLHNNDAASLATPPPTHLVDDHHAEAENGLWNLPLAPQGRGPSQLTPAEQSLEPDRCARCHAQQFAQSRTTVHAAAMGPGVLGQLVDMPARDVVQCQNCHAPLAEQSPFVADAPPVAGAMTMRGGPSDPSAADLARNPDFDAELRPQGIVCAACHLRGRARFGPPRRADSARLAGSLYPLTTLSRYERGDFCAPCHQHTVADAVGGHPILNTVAEWIEGPYFARGVECQHCHMPDRDHTWRGAHDADTVRQALHVYVRFARSNSEAVATVHVENVGAGHAFPGTATPAAVVTLEWLDANGTTLGAPVRDVIQRHLEWDGRAFHQTFDTRIPPGGERAIEARTHDARARSLRYTLTFRPDDYYEGFYRQEIDRPGRSERGRAMLRAALEHARNSPFVVRTDTLAIP